MTMNGATANASSISFSTWPRLLPKRASLEARHICTVYSQRNFCRSSYLAPGINEYVKHTIQAGSKNLLMYSLTAISRV